MKSQIIINTQYWNYNVVKGKKMPIVTTTYAYAIMIIDMSNESSEEEDFFLYSSNYVEKTLTSSSLQMNSQASNFWMCKIRNLMWL